ncbi:hypothetical protein CGRA01v4_03749 [Colletotrichum graminicola]|nr:hypothetical protein CGRA01v4_03749 [Colletotrichum graminicola]
MVKGRARQARSHDHQMLRFQPVEGFKRRIYACVCSRGDSESHPRNDIGQRKSRFRARGMGPRRPRNILNFHDVTFLFLYFFLSFPSRTQTRVWFSLTLSWSLAVVCETKRGFRCVWRNQKMYCDGERKGREGRGGARSGQAR